MRGIDDDGSRPRGYDAQGERPTCFPAHGEGWVKTGRAYGKPRQEKGRGNDAAEPGVMIGSAESSHSILITAFIHRRECP